MRTRHARAAPLTIAVLASEADDASGEHGIATSLVGAIADAVAEVSLTTIASLVAACAIVGGCLHLGNHAVDTGGLGAHISTAARAHDETRAVASARTYTTSSQSSGSLSGDERRDAQDERGQEELHDE